MMDITILSFDHPIVSSLLDNIGKHIHSKNSVSYDCRFSDCKDEYECIISLQVEKNQHILLRSRYDIGDKILNRIYNMLDECIYVNPEMTFTNNCITISKDRYKKFIYYHEIDHIRKQHNSLIIGLRGGDKIRIDIWAPGIRDLYFSKLSMIR